MTPPLTWINDRLPTEADGDRWGDVVIATEDGGGWEIDQWYNVPQSTAWLAFKPADAANFLNSIAAAVEAGQRRRIISITRTVYGAVHTIDAVADDGTAWWMVPGEVDWTQLPALPQREADRAAGVVS